MYVYPATGQVFTGRKADLGFAEHISFWYILTIVESGGKRGFNWVEEFLEIEYLDEMSTVFFFQEHRYPPEFGILVYLS